MSVPLNSTGNSTDLPPGPPGGIDVDTTGGDGGDLQVGMDDYGDVFAEVKAPNGFILAHIFVSLVTFTVLIPISIALHRRAPKLHVVLNSTSVLLTLVSVYLAHRGDRTWRTWAEELGWEFGDLSQDVHNGLGWALVAMVLLQGPLLGVLRWHLRSLDAALLRNVFADQSKYAVLRAVVTRLHAAVGYSVVPVAYMVTAAGGVALTGTCGIDGIEGCASHLFFGSLLLWYGGLSLITFLSLPPTSLPRPGPSPELYESLSLLSFGFIVILSRAIWGRPSAATGLVLSAGGIVGLVVERTKMLNWRNPVPGMIMVAIGVNVASRAGYDPDAVEEDDFIAVAETYFGYTLVMAGVSRVLATSLRPLPAPVPSSTPRYVPLSSSESTLPVPTDDDLSHLPQPATIPTPRADSIPSFMHRFFLLVAGVLYIGSSSSGVPPKWALAADLDALGYANLLVGVAFGGAAWLVLVSSLYAAAAGTAPKSDVEDHSGEHGERQVEVEARGKGKGVNGARGSGRPAGSDVEMDAFLDE